MTNTLANKTILGASFWKFLLLFAALLLSYSSQAFAESPPPDASASEPAAPVETYGSFKESEGYATFATDNLWILLAAFLVFIMHLGFATLESGLCQKKNTVNILFKNCFIISMGVISYYVIGFNTHYPGDFNGFFKLGSPLTDAFTDSVNEEGVTHSFANLTSEYADYTYWSDFLFQAMFAATAATIVSGAVAERVKLSAFLVHATVLVAIGYTVAGSWHWGGGFLTTLGDALDADGNKIAAAAIEAGAEADSYSNAFYDFAGSTVVHAFGGFAALAFVMVLGPRKGKYTESGIKPIVGHSMPLAAIGVFLLFLGWFGFNGGSVLSADSELISRVCVTTALAACAGALASMLVSTFVIKKPDLSMALNGFLAGLVGITAGADAISPAMSIVTGAIAGAIVVFSIIAFDKAKIDDPVGAISVHGICGIWGTLAVAFFGGASLTGQIIGIVCVSLFAFVFSYALALILKSTIGVRVSEEEEERGLDISEHGQEAYSS
jgi:Amt family ammonium transporter